MKSQILIQQLGMWQEERSSGVRQAAQDKRSSFLKSRAAEERHESEKGMKVAKDTLGPSAMRCIDQIRSDHGHSNRWRRSRKKNLSDHVRSD